MARYQRYLFPALLIGLISALLLAGGMFNRADAQGRTEQLIQARAQSVTGDRFPVYTTTPRGMRIFAV